MHPAFSVIFFTTASGAGFGLWAWFGLLALTGTLPSRGASLPCRRVSQSLNCTRSALKPGVLALARLTATTSMTRCCAARREAATLLGMSMPQWEQALCHVG